MHPEDENLPASADDSSMIHRRIHSFKHSRGGRAMTRLSVVIVFHNMRREADEPFTRCR